MGFLGAFVYDMEDDENFMTAKSKTFKHILNENPRQRASTRNQSHSQSVSNPSGKRTSMQSQAGSCRRRKRISSQSQIQLQSVSEHSSQQSPNRAGSCRRSKRISSQSQIQWKSVTKNGGQPNSNQSQAAFRRGQRNRQPARDSIFAYENS